MSSRAALAFALFLPGCLLGADPFKGAPNVPTLDGEPVLIQPLPDERGEVWAREGTEVIVELRLITPVDLDLTTVRLDDAPLTCAQPDSGSPVYRCSRTMDGTEANGPKSLSGTLAFDETTTTRLVSTPLLTADFIPPTAACVLSPRFANAQDTPSLVVTPSEPLREPPAVTSSAPELSVTFREQIEGQFFFDLAGEPDTNLDSYVLTVEAFDRAGNPQRGDSLCDPADRTGTLLGQGPALDGDVSLNADPSVDVGGVPWVREGALLTLSIPTVAPIDRQTSSVALSGLALEPVEDDPALWTLALDGSEGDGFKNLDAVLFDAAGNRLRIQRSGIVRFDFTPPTADCVLSPSQANGEDNVLFDIFASEPLRGGAPTVTVSDPRITVGPPTTTGNQHRFTITGVPGEDIAYTLQASATDRAGNPPEGPLCDPDDTTGSILARGPELIGDIGVSLTPSIDLDGIPTATRDAELRVTVPTAQPVDPGRSLLTLSGVPLEPDPTQPGTWVRVLDGTEGDGLKNLDVRLVDLAGNQRNETRAGVVRFDFTPPAASCLLAPNPANGTQTVTFTLAANEPLRDPPTLTSAEVDLDPPTFDGTRWTARVHAPSAATTDYTVSVEATDRVGNTATDEAVCPEADRTGRVEAIPPTLDGAPTLTATPSVVGSDGIPRVAAGAQVDLSFELTQPTLDPTQSIVTLSGFRLNFDRLDGRRYHFTAPVTGTEVEGTRTLDLRLIDQVGNETVLALPDQALTFDFTAPSATCLLSPPVANANQARSGITLTLISTEALSPEGPILSLDTPQLQIDEVTQGDTTWVVRLSSTVSEEDFSYLVGVELTDLVGNTASGDAVCAASQRSGVVRGRRPALTGPPELTVTPSVQPRGLRIARAGATLRVQFTTEAPILTDAPTSVSLSDLELPLNTAIDTTYRWQRTLTADDGEGLKQLALTLVDDVGNTRTVSFSDAPYAFIADFTAPQIVSSLLLRIPFLATAERPSGRVLFNEADPITGQTVQATLQVFTDEPLEGTSTLHVTGPGPLLFSGGAPNGNRTTFTRDTFVGAAEGTYTLEVTVRDEVGNEARRTLAPTDLVLDRTPPTDAPTVDVPQAVVHHRAPWGTFGKGGPEFFLEAQPGALVPNALITAETPSGSLLASTFSADDGSLPALPLGGDLPSVFLRIHDDAGNPGPATRIRDVFWTAPLPAQGAADIPGSSPHTLRSYDTLGPELFARSRPVSGAPAQHEYTNPWVPWEGMTSARPAARRHHAMAYDAARGVTLLFGGEAGSSGACGTSGSTRCSDTWEWNGVRWRLLSPDLAPPARSNHGMAYDSRRGVIVLFGGIGEPGTCSSDTMCEDTWEWDGTTWTERTPKDRPSPRADAAFAFHDPGGHVLLFGGRRDNGTHLGDAWVWDGHDWTERTVPPDSGPSPRSWARMTYDPVRQQTLLFGGLSDNPSACAGTGSTCGDIWSWDGSGWKNVSPSSGPTPTPRGQHVMAFDALTERVLVIGGFSGVAGACGSTTSCDDVWSWDGSSWQPLTSASGDHPPGSRWAAGAYDRARRQLVHFGGSRGSSLSRETWRWTSDDWVEATPAGTPPGRHSAPMVYDTQRDVLLLFGGDGPSQCGPDLGSPYCTDTWQWHPDTGWVDRSPGLIGGTFSGPPGRYGHAMAYESGNGTPLIFGGFGNCGTLGVPARCRDTWRWNGDRWTEVTPTSLLPPFPPSPSRRTRTAMAHHDGIDATFLFGGETSSGVVRDTWRWTGSAWQELSFPSGAPRPSARSGHAMVYDPIDDVIVLFGGIDGNDTLLSDTWIWDGSAWVHATPAGPGGAPSPPARQGHRMVFDPLRETVVLFGGIGGSPGQCATRSIHCDDTWEWTGSSWILRQPSDQPAPRRDFAMAYHPKAEAAVLFGGRGPSNVACNATSTDPDRCADTWLAPSFTDARPGLAMAVTFGAAQAPQATVQSVLTRWRAGGQGDPSGVRPTDGAALVAWSGRDWAQLDAHTAPTEAPEELCSHLVRDASQPVSPGCVARVDRALTDSLFQFGPERRGFFAVQPVAPMGADDASVATEDAAIEVRYRVP